MLNWKKFPYNVDLKGQTFRIDIVRNESDLADLESTLAESDLSPGQQTLRLLFGCTHDTRGWVIFRDQENQCAGGYVLNAYENGLVFGYLGCIARKYRSFGLGKYLLDSPVGMGNQTLMSIKNLKYEAWSFKIISMAGNVKPFKRNQDILKDERIKIQELTPDLLPELLIYDSTILPGVNRRSFTEKWTTKFADSGYNVGAGKQQTLIAIDSNTNRILGYGVTRSDKYSTLAPLYSNSPKIAMALFEALFEPYEGKWIYYQCQAGNITMWKMARKMGLEVMEAEMRAYITVKNRAAFEFDKSVHYERVFAMLEYWPA